MEKQKVPIKYLQDITKFLKTDAGKDLIKRLEELEKGNLNLAEVMPEKVAVPNEQICAYVQRAKGVRLVIDLLNSAEVALKMKKKGEK